MHELVGKACTNLRVVTPVGTVPADSAEQCCEECAARPACGAWTFHGVAAKSCTLADRASYPGSVSGATCGSKQPMPPAPGPPAPEANVTVAEFAQTIDHFGNVPGTFQQKYAFWGGVWGGPGYPIFLVMPEESAFNPARLTVRNTMYDIAVQYYGALIVGIVPVDV